MRTDSFSKYECQTTWSHARAGAEEWGLTWSTQVKLCQNSQTWELGPKSQKLLQANGQWYPAVNKRKLSIGGPSKDNLRIAFLNAGRGLKGKVKINISWISSQEIWFLYRNSGIDVNSKWLVEYLDISNNFEFDIKIG